MKNTILTIFLASILLIHFIYYKDNKTAQSPSYQAQLNSPTTAPNHKDPTSLSAEALQFTQQINKSNAIENRDSTDKTHAHIAKDIKNELCIEAKEHIHTCTINTHVDIQSKVIDTKTGNIKADELATIVASSNFAEVLEQLSLSKLLNESYIREAKLNDQLNDLLVNTTNIASNGIFCGDQACAVSFTYKDTNAWTEFQHAFFNQNDTGNVFMQFMESNANEDLEVRMFFFPGNNAGVTERLNKS